MLRLMKPRVLFAFDATEAVCFFQFRSVAISIPRYLADLMISNTTS